jgi:hypothetical protein
VRRIIYRAAKHKAKDIVRRQALSIKRFLKSHSDVANRDGQEQALLSLTDSHIKYSHVIGAITLLMKHLPDHLKKDLMSKERTDLMKIGVIILQQALRAHG